MGERIPSDWQPDRKVYDKAEAAGMDIKWVKEQLARFIEITEDRGQSLNRHFDNFLLRNHQVKRHNTTRPQPPEWESQELQKADPDTGNSYLQKLRETL